jgi:hypothetical protein
MIKSTSSSSTIGTKQESLKGRGIGWVSAIEPKFKNM